MTNLIELFELTMDSVFYLGYTKQLCEDDPARYQWELDEFIRNNE